MDLAASSTLEARRPADHRLGPYSTDGYWPLTLTHPSVNEGFEDMDSDDSDSSSTQPDAPDAPDDPDAPMVVAGGAAAGGAGRGGSTAGSPPRLLTKFAQPDSPNKGVSSATYRRDDRRVVGNEYDWGTYAHDRIVHGYGDDDDEGEGESGDDDEEYVSQMERFQTLMQFLTQVGRNTIYSLSYRVLPVFFCSCDACAVAVSSHIARPSHCVVVLTC